MPPGLLQSLVLSENSIPVSPQSVQYPPCGVRSHPSRFLQEIHSYFILTVSLQCAFRKYLRVLPLWVLSIPYFSKYYEGGRLWKERFSLGFPITSEVYNSVIFFRSVWSLIEIASKNQTGDGSMMGQDLDIPSCLAPNLP